VTTIFAALGVHAGCGDCRLFLDIGDALSEFIVKKIAGSRAQNMELT
jgi:hypothetical protein